ncbi:hypothetical protein [Streptomyces zagrosensis]|uniref:Uncharacterized protein n=1 Tax=Streptomyces zagrosensis TaxID=1042984 RepID=A0A7W9QDL2_9ACTN|nr:hypothetical protein [Streptomyces zagrosensis]MBB5938181.1 hypothetical protein [Streptomyces zagrosensis]
MPEGLKGRSTRRHRVTAAMLGSIVLAGVVAVHVAGDSPQRDASPASGSRPVPVSEAHPLSAEEKTVLHAAEQVLLRDCMRRQGFKYQVTSENPLPEAREFPYVVDDLAWAAEHGYGSGLQRALEKIKENDPNQRYFRSLPPERRTAALTAANGPRPKGLTARSPDGMVLSRSDQGCQSEAERTLYGDLKGWFQTQVTVDSLPGLRHQRVRADRRFTTAVRKWSGCMHTAGHPYATPDNARAALTSSAPRQPAPSHQEVRLALAEARCAAESGFSKTIAGLDRHYEKELRRQYRTAVHTSAQLQLGALPRARKITAGKATHAGVAQRTPREAATPPKETP